MTIKVYDIASGWQPQKSLKIHNGTSWSSVLKGWIYNGTSWSQFYPEYPSNSVAPSVSGSTPYGSTLTSTTGTWNTTDAYLGTYSYQWTKAGTNISGATSSTYTTVSGDVGSAIACKVTSTNNRGTTTVASSNSITPTNPLPGPPGTLTLTDGTTTPGAPGSVSVSITGQTTANVSWTAGTGNISFYDGYASVGTLGSINSTARTASITGGTAGSSTTVYIRSANYNGIINMSWTAGSGATSYDIYVNGSYITNTASTSYNYTIGSTGSKSVTIYSKNSYGTETTGKSGTVSLATKYSGYTTGSGTFTAAGTAPGPVTGLSAVFRGYAYSDEFYDYIRVTWSAPSTGTSPFTYEAKCYEVTSTSQTTPGTGTLWSNGGTNASSPWDVGGFTNHIYAFDLRASNSYGTGNWSRVICTIP